MKSTGIVRKVDDLGRVVIPIELRRTLNIAVKDPLEIHVEGDQIVLRKHSVRCTFCGNETEITRFKGKHICQSCLKEIQYDFSSNAS